MGAISFEKKPSVGSNTSGSTAHIRMYERLASELSSDDVPRPVVVASGKSTQSVRTLEEYQKKQKESETLDIARLRDLQEMAKTGHRRQARLGAADKPRTV